MAKKTFDIEKAFTNKSVFSIDELEEYIRSIRKHTNLDNIRQLISRQKRAGRVVSIKKGLYMFSHGRIFVNPSDKFVMKLSKLFSSRYPEINYCIWPSSWLNEFTVHQPSYFFYIFETEPDMVETTFYLLKDKGYEAFLNPDSQTMQLYVIGKKNPVIVKTLVSRAPLIKKNSVRLPSLEKILVDVFSDKKLFYFIQGHELQNIFKFAFRKYSVNISSLLNYSVRRGNNNKLAVYIKKNISYLTSILTDD